MDSLCGLSPTAPQVDKKVLKGSIGTVGVVDVSSVSSQLDLQWVTFHSSAIYE